MNKEILTQELVKNLFNYNEETGLLFWKNRGKGIRFNKPAGHIHAGTGYIKLNVNGSKHQAHRIIYLYVYGELPQYIDHINGIRHDNRICNLRKATQAQNMMNIKKHSSNTSGYKGVDFVKSKNKYRARCRVNKKRYELGLYATAYEAHLAYKKFAIMNHGEFYHEN